MAKIAFNKLNLKLNQAEQSVMYNEQEILVKQYLPIVDKMSFIDKISLYMFQNNPHVFNPGAVEALMTFFMIENYSNISFTDKQKENIEKIYDILVSTGFAKLVLDLIPKTEYEMCYTLLNSNLDNLYKYANSAAGLIEKAASSFGDASLDLAKIKEEVGTIDGLDMVKSLITNLG